MAGIALDHGIRGLKGGVGNFSNRQLLMIRFLVGDDWRVRREQEVDPGVGNQVGLELGHIDVQSSVESERSSHRRDDLGNQTIQIGIRWAFNVQGSTANVVLGLVVKIDCNIGMLQQRVGGQDGVVRFCDSGGNLGSWEHAEAQFTLFFRSPQKVAPEAATQAQTQCLRRQHGIP